MSEFEEQLKQEELAQQQWESGESTRTEYTDTDGTVFEWDPHKKAWFPKIDADFIAKYQMSYGVDQTPGSGDKENSEASEINPETGKKYTKEECEKYWKDYYNYYYQQTDTGTGDQEGEQGDGSTTGTQGASGEEVKSLGTEQSSRPDDDEDRNSDYYHYFSQYYDENYIPSSSQGEGRREGDGDQDRSKANQGKGKAAGKAGEKRKPDAGWVEIDDEKNTNVYVSGLPLDVTNEEFQELMSKYGLIMPDLVTKEPKIKLYRDENGEPKGDGRCCYIKVESVNLALQILDGSDLRGHTVHVERAKFTMKGNFDPKKKRKKLSAKEKKKLVQQQQKLLDWKPDVADTRMRWEKVVVLKHMFDPKEFEEDPMLINELREDVRVEASKYGEVKKVILYDRHPEGVMTVHFKEFECADLCVKGLNGRWFAKKQITAEPWDGKTKYEIEESNAEREERLKKWSDFLESDDGKGQPTSTSGEASVGASSSEKTAAVASSASGDSASASASGNSAPDGVTDVGAQMTPDSSLNSGSAAGAPVP